MAAKNTTELHFKFGYLGDIIDIIAKQQNGIKLFKVSTCTKKQHRIYHKMYDFEQGNVFITA